ncbi:hypothetical protein [Pedobacter sp. SL55]|uniref:hypothetical protein n=1 Tax=Pedobacter sp. SL55 TaxID=2995161 RepID=UPI0022703776|nr:hypothetical protein [Pedobacter sp. SL55]WAC39615.1 hypothetical protein OVA16_13615 [Pedobacter sp. SL55]
MKKLLLTLSLAAILFSAEAQKIIITGVMFDPQGGDAPAVGVVAGNYTHKGGYEYIQLMATENIDFSQTPHCVVRCTNSGTTNGAPNNGWAETGVDRTFKFNLTSGTVNKGEFFYVGGPEKAAGGFLVDGGTTYYPVLDITSSKWIRTIAYSVGTNSSPIGDDGIGMTTTGLMPNIVKGSSARPFGIAVFEGNLVSGLPNVAITVNSVPVDAIFVGYSNSNVLAGVNPLTHDRDNVYFPANAPNNCYRMPNTDRYTAGYMGDPNNQYVYSGQSVENVGSFLKLGGVFNTDDKTWVTPRVGNYVQLVPPSAFGTVVERTSFATLAMIEGNVAGYNGTSIPVTTLISPLPVKLASFTAKANKQGTVSLAWSTASEQNNSHFEVTRSADGKSFAKIGQVQGNGNSSTTKNYSYVDASPVAGVNYYQLKQVDFDGTYELSGVVSAKVGLSNDNLTASASANRTLVAVTYNALANGKALFNVYSISGAKIATVEQTVTAGLNKISIPANLGNSIHILNVSQAGATASIKF